MKRKEGCNKEFSSRQHPKASKTGSTVINQNHFYTPNKSSSLSAFYSPSFSPPILGVPSGEISSLQQHHAVRKYVPMDLNTDNRSTPFRGSVHGKWRVGSGVEGPVCDGHETIFTDVSLQY